ncbi:hypothetical protein [Methylovulum psychrotolerans]|uniref:hypothetical protein n=1 Tax=Methylovulum psychrotolerans TaxID=1704499 RepID=UPI0011B02819|nr:hypothetical protein [Methylovulum psychrotolerans]
MVYTAATLSANFQCPGNWRSASEQDADPDNGNRPHISDAAYSNILRLAQHWSGHLYQNFAPKFVTESGIIIP